MEEKEKEEEKEEELQITSSFVKLMPLHLAWQAWDFCDMIP